jgi:AraC family transcriptional regulator, regulatory protein of adaptative response / methylated-DNA-[protein]-cysteine methyltransferase
MTYPERSPFMEYRSMSQSSPVPSRILTDDDRWQAVVSRDRSVEGQFVLAVHTTGIFCRPGCPARTPKRENTSFFATPADAIRAGYRPCKRCKPTGESITDKQRHIVEDAQRQIEAADTALTLDDIAATVGMSPWHLQRLFKAHTGISPAQYQRSLRSDRLRSAIKDAPTVTQALHDSGYGSSSQFYAATHQALGMSPTAFRAGGAGQRIRYGIVQTWLGCILVAATDRGIASLQMGDTEDELRDGLVATFPNADLVDDDADFSRTIQQVVELVERPWQTTPIAVDVRGTVFQHRVWAALRQIPAGSTRTYSEVAEAIGAPTAARAVAKACADNPVPLIVPCHRVIGKNGSLTGYRYGIERKRALLEREGGEDTSERIP